MKTTCILFLLCLSVYNARVIPLKSSSSSQLTEGKIPDQKEVSLSSCNLLSACRRCTFDELLSSSECNATGNIIVYSCPQMDLPILMKCGEEATSTPLLGITAILWGCVFVGMYYFINFKEKLEVKLQKNARHKAARTRA